MGRSNSHIGRSGARPARQMFLLPSLSLWVDGVGIPLHSRTQRLFALLTVTPRRMMSRSQAAGLLWPETPQGKALCNLRSTLRQLRRVDPGILSADSDSIAMCPSVEVDWERASRVAAAALDPSAPCPPASAWVVLQHPLLAGWSDPWLALEQALYDQLRVQALEALCARLAAEGNSGDAVRAGLMAVNCDPLRESAHRVLIEAHLTEGNVGAAVAQLGRFKQVLDTELGLRPSPQMRDLVMSAMATTR